MVHLNEWLHAGFYQYDNTKTRSNAKTNPENFHDLPGLENFYFIFEIHNKFYYRSQVFKPLNGMQNIVENVDFLVFGKRAMRAKVEAKLPLK